MQPDPNARPEYIGAFREIVERITGTLSALPRRALPIKMYVAGGAYRDGAARLLYFDRQYSDTCALRHEDAYDDSVLLSLEGHDDRVLEVRLLSALDLAVSKLGRFSSQDRDDITALARRKLIESGPLRLRAEQALSAYVGNTERVQGSIEIACRIVSDLERRKTRIRH
jgi:hypothetical protein